MKNDNAIQGHGAVIFTILVWGTTFISTKILLIDFKPIEILFYRFCLGFVVLLAVYPRWLKLRSVKEELFYAAAGLCGVTLYYLAENIALTLTTASNVGVIVSVAPLFTGILANFLLAGEKPKAAFFIGFFTAILGVILISFNKDASLKFNGAGDLLAVLAALVWAVYSILSRKISQFGYNTIQTTRRIFFYSLILMIPPLFIFHFEPGLERFLLPLNIFNILFLGLGASALCFVTWNFAVKVLGAVRTSVYIYAIPVVTVVTSAIVLHEKVTWMLASGTLLILAGLFISERKAVAVKKEQYTP